MKQKSRIVTILKRKSSHDHEIERVINTAFDPGKGDRKLERKQVDSNIIPLVELFTSEKDQKASAFYKKQQKIIVLQMV